LSLRGYLHQLTFFVGLAYDTMAAVKVDSDVRFC